MPRLRVSPLAVRRQLLTRSPTWRPRSSWRATAALLALPLLAALATGAQAQNTPPAPTGFTATPGDTEVTLRWLDPGNSDISKYQYRQGTGDTPTLGNWMDIANSDNETAIHTVTGLANGTKYSFQIRAVAGTSVNGAASATAAATPGTVAATVSFSQSAFFAFEQVGSVSVTVGLSASVSAAVEVYFTSGGGTARKGSDYAAGTVIAPSGLAGTYKITIPAGSTSGMTTIEIIDDSLPEASTENFTLALHQVVSTAVIGWGGRITSAVNISDNDAGPQLPDPATLTVTEASSGRTGTYDVRLSMQPSATITVSVVSQDTSVAGVAPASLTFNNSNWNMAQTVMVTAVDDNVDQTTDRTAVIRHTASGSGDPRFRGVADLTVTVTDDDDLPVVSVNIIRGEGRLVRDGALVLGEGLPAIDAVP